MTCQNSFIAVALLVFIQLWGRFAFATSNCGPDGVQASGSIYRICMPAPEDYNNRLVVFAHGFQDAPTPVRIPEEQLAVGGLSLPALVNGLGFGFATNSYSKTGLAVRQGMDDLLDLVDIYTDQQGPPEKIYLTGASEGGLITALLTELHPKVFTGGLAACGPVGDFPFHIRYFGNARATFEYLFPGLIPGYPFHPPQELIDQWGSFYEQSVVPVVFAASNRDTLDQWVKVARLPFDPANYRSTVAQSVADVLRYSVVKS